MLTEINLIGLNNTERKMANELKQYYDKCKLDSTKCINNEQKQFYNGKASGANDVAISFFNIDLSDI